jgi:hypothetical protein
MIYYIATVLAYFSYSRGGKMQIYDITMLCVFVPLFQDFKVQWIFMKFGGDIMPFKPTKIYSIIS